jgi:hypothetical protein
MSQIPGNDGASAWGYYEYPVSPRAVPKRTAEEKRELEVVLAREWLKQEGFPLPYAIVSGWSLNQFCELIDWLEARASSRLVHSKRPLPPPPDWLLAQIEAHSS